MSISASLIKLVSLEEMDSGATIIPAVFSSELEGDFKVAIHIKSRKKIDVIGIKMQPGKKMYYVGLEIIKDHIGQVVQMMGKMITKEDLRWTTGICVIDEDVDYKDFDGCLWHGIVYAKDDVTVDSMKKQFMQINADYDKRIVSRVVIKEVKKK